MHLILLYSSILLFSYASQAQMINTTPGFKGVEIINEFDMDNNLTIQTISDSETEYELVNNECRRIGGKLGSVSYEDCNALSLNLTGSYSNKNAPILFKEYPPLASRTPRGRVLLIGGVHGDEYSSVSIIFKWLKTLDEFHSGLFHWHISPLVNPDGLLRDGSTRTNAKGVDINRNFPIPDWEDTALHYWMNNAGRSDRKYPGPHAMSEPETSWVVNKINAFKPDVIISVHAPHGVVDYDGPEDGPYKLGRLYLNLLGTYPGSLGNYAGIQRQIPVVTIELPYAGIMPTPQEISDIWRDLVRWLIDNIPQASQELNVQETDPS
jgi:murein peptide amidase A